MAEHDRGRQVAHKQDYLEDLVAHARRSDPLAEGLGAEWIEGYLEAAAHFGELAILHPATRGEIEANQIAHFELCGVPAE